MISIVLKSQGEKEWLKLLLFLIFSVKVISLDNQISVAKPEWNDSTDYVDVDRKIGDYNHAVCMHIWV